jgi:hypothetical protein
MRTRTLVLALIAGCFLPPLHAQAEVMIGVFANQNGKSLNFSAPEEGKNNLLEVEKGMGRKVAIDGEYITWNGFSSANPPVQMQWDARNGRIPHLTWKFNMPGSRVRCVNWKDVVSGVYDAQLRDQAHVLADLKSRVIIRLWPAMEQHNMTCVYGVDPTIDPATAAPRFIQSWQHIVGLMRPIAPLVEWNWSPNIHSFTDNRGNPSTKWKPFWPGDRYVDWIGTLLYDTGNSDVAVDRSPIFRTFYDQASALGKKIIFSETGAVGPDPQVEANGQGCPGARFGGSPSAQYTFLHSFRTGLPKFKQVQAFVYFNAAAVAGNICHNFILRGDGMSELAKMASDPYFVAH